MNPSPIYLPVSPLHPLPLQCLSQNKTEFQSKIKNKNKTNKQKTKEQDLDGEVVG